MGNLLFHLFRAEGSFFLRTSSLLYFDYLLLETFSHPSRFEKRMSSLSFFIALPESIESLAISIPSPRFETLPGRHKDSRTHLKGPHRAGVLDPFGGSQE